MAQPGSPRHARIPRTSRHPHHPQTLGDIDRSSEYAQTYNKSAATNDFCVQHPSAPSRVWGAAYRIPASHVEEVRAYLDIREINGYSADMAAFHVPVHIPRHEAAADLTSGQRPETMSAPAPISCLVYIGTPENPQFVGPQDMDALAEHIAQSKGPSGRNAEYVYELAAALEQIRKDVGADIEVDEHAADLARRVRQMEKRTTGKTLQVGNEDRQVTMEETE